MIFIFFLILFLASVSAKSLPADIKKCRISDPNLNQCLKTNGVDAIHKLVQGNKDLGLVQLDPFIIKQLDFGDFSESGSLHPIYNNIHIYGLSNIMINNDSYTNMTEDNLYWSFSSFSPLVRIESDYEMKGQLLIFTINGHGKCNNTFYNSIGQFEFNLERYTKKKEKYLRLAKLNYKLKPKKVVFEYDNIIDGNEQLSQEVVKTINENALSVFADIEPAIEQLMATVYNRTINSFFSRIPESELFLP